MCFVLGLLVVCGLPLRGHGDVTSFQADVSSSIVQFQNGIETQRNDQSMSYQGTIPIQVSHTLSGQSPDFGAFNRVLANDPQYNSAIPRDFIQESAIGSADSNISLQVNSLASQTRKLNLLSSEFPNQSVGSQVNLVSKFTLDGALAAVVPSTAASAEGLLVTCSLKILQNENEIWTGAVRMTGQSNGTVTAASSGNIHDSDFVFAQNTISGMGKIWIVAFDDVELPYSYQGNVGDNFDLTAQLSMDFTVPGGLGAGSAFGTVPTEMILLSQQLFEQHSTPSNAKGIAFAPAPEPTTLILLITGITILNRRKRQ